MFFALDRLVEARIAEATAAGEFDDLPGAGQPLSLDNDALVPEEIRVAYRMLKNAGFAPPEVMKLREAAGLQAALTAACDELADSRETRTVQMQRRLVAVSIALDAQGVDLARVAGGRYYRKTVDKLVGRPSETVPRDESPT